MRDAGWVQLYDEDVQEAYDNAIQAVRIAEHPDVLLPTIHALDGFILGHSVERLEKLPDEAVKEFIGTYTPAYPLLDVEHPVSYGPMDLQDYFFEHKRQQAEAMVHALDVVAQVAEEYGDLTGRYHSLIEGYRLDDADFITVMLGSTVGTAKTAVDLMREQGIKAGMLKIRCFRPFPAEAVAEALADRKAIAVLDRSLSFGAQINPLCLEVIAALHSHGLAPTIINYVYGLGGRDTVPAQICEIYQELVSIERDSVTGPLLRYLAVRD
jgi:pyruvate ferredoxin oxidoreductase alpha subunit